MGDRSVTEASLGAVPSTGAAAPPELVFRSSAPEIVVGHDQRIADGLAHWVAGTMGFHRRPGRTTVIAPNGGRVARHEYADVRFNSGPIATDIAISAQLAASDHASGGPLYHDEASDQLLLIYHGETFNDGDADDYYAFLGMAVSDDHGATFEDLGRIITSDLAEHDPERHRPVDVGSGAYVVRDGWMHVYFQDRGNGPCRRSLSVARARVTDVVDAARNRTTPVFHKYHDGTWEEPGIGGVSSELFDDAFRWVVWFDAAVIESIGCVVLVYSTSWLVDGVPHWMHMATLSTDGIRWSPSQPLYDTPLTDEVIYVTIDSGGDQQRSITGSSFDLYRTRATTKFRWDEAWLERITVSFEVVEP
jgi:hypothetical protein